MHFTPRRKSGKQPFSETPSSATTEPQESNKDEEIPLMIQDTIITQVREAKFLGVIIDDELSWTSHINDLKKRLRCHIGSMAQAKVDPLLKLQKKCL